MLHAGVNFSIGVPGVETLTADSRVLTIFVAQLAALALVLYLQIRSVTDMLSSAKKQ